MLLGICQVAFVFYKFKMSFENKNITIRKPKLNAENKRMYFPVFPLLCFVYSLNVIRLARDAISVPVPPILTPTSNAG